MSYELSNTMTVTDLNKSKIIERPKLSSRTSSFSDVLAKFTSTRLNRRRGNNESLATFSSDTINLRSSIRTPSKIPRSSSFFGSLNAFKTKTATISSDEVDQAVEQTPSFENGGYSNADPALSSCLRNSRAPDRGRQHLSLQVIEKVDRLLKSLDGD